MELFKKTPYNNSVRHQLNIKKVLLTKKTNVQKILLKGKKCCFGRSSLCGKITIGSKGGGHKSLFRRINFTYGQNFSILISVFYDPKRTGFVSLCYNFLTQKFANYLTTYNTFPGSVIFSYLTLPELKLGVFLSLLRVPTGSLIHSIFISNKSKYIKAAGVFGILIQKGIHYSKVKLPSGDVKILLTSSYCILGSLSNAEHKNSIIGKAGRSRLLNKRPKVRGVAMNPVDHPHGGQTSGGIPSVTPWGLPTKGKPTKKNVTRKLERAFF